MRLPRPTLTATAMTVATLALVLIGAAVVFDAVGAELQRRTFTRLAQTGYSNDPIEVESIVLDGNQHIEGDPGEEVTIELGPGVWQVLGGGGEEHPVTLASHVRPVIRTWTGIQNVISVLPLDEADRARIVDTPVLPAGPMTLSVDTDEAWVVDFRRQVCPGDYASS
ncbi:MAG: hypothetical protein OXG33_08705 [Chloroflexi bacterium]|nr:hypothetical protein [Chloroflexota bacterium]